MRAGQNEAAQREEAAATAETRSTVTARRASRSSRP